jgi:predicted ATPase
MELWEVKMPITVKVLGLRAKPSRGLRGVVQLSAGDWDDYSFKTSFRATFCDFDGKEVDLGTVKIGYVDQPHGWTKDTLHENFEHLPEAWFSLGQDVDYYKKAYSELNVEDRSQILSALRDVVADQSSLVIAQQQMVFKDSLTRTVSPSTIHGQFQRVLKGEAALTDFQFTYAQEANERHAPVKLSFAVKAASKPPTNVHVLIGRNGVGKTTLLNNMVGALLNSPRPDQPPSRFLQSNPFISLNPLPNDYFSSVVSVSFSAFDPFVPPADRPADRTLGPAYFYVGMKKMRADHAVETQPAPKTGAELVNDFAESFESCLSQPAKRARWLAAIKRLESDLNFEEMDLGRLLELDDDIAVEKAHSMVSRMSSGHSIVLLTLTKLVDSVEEKTLVLLDEPESHLHPPLLSAFTRALSDLLYARNGVAIVATHSPVVLQEVPSSCVWKLTRIRTQGRADRPERETFGENVGILTRETFGLEVSKSGFHEMMHKAVEVGGTFESILADYGNQLGAEARAILLSQIAARDASKVDEK